MSTEQPGRPGRSGTASANAPVGSTVAIVVAIVATVLGFFVLKQIRSDSDDPAVSAPNETTAPTTASTLPEITQPVITAAPTLPPPVIDAAITIVVANAADKKGVARNLTTELQALGFTLGEPTNGSANVDVTKVLWDDAVPAAQAVAESLGVQLGNVPVETIATPAPIDGGVLPEGVAIVVLVGKDKGGQTLAQMSGLAPITPVVETTSTLPAG
jgi:LytR cell envelope-related transcriptional attenuator